MITDTENVTFFVLSCERYGDTYNAMAMLLTPARAVDLPDQQWLLWPQGFDVPVQCGLRSFEWIGSGIDATGLSITLYDDEPYLHSSVEGVVQASSNSVRLSLQSTGGSVPLDINRPFFLNPDKQHGFSEINAFVRMSLQNLDQSPDVQGHFEFFETPLLKERQPRMTTIVEDMLEQFKRIARGTPPKVGMYFPVGFLSSGENILAVLYLEEQHHENDFKCRIFINADVTSISSGTHLTRDLIWSDEGKQRQLRASICTVLNSPFP